MVDADALADRDNKLDGEIVNVVREEREWRKMKYWPAEFKKREAYGEDDDESEEESRVGKMPSDDEDEED